MAYQTFTHQIWWVMVCYDLAHQIRCAKHTFSGWCDIPPMVCCSFGGHSTPQFLQCSFPTFSPPLTNIFSNFFCMFFFTILLTFYKHSLLFFFLLCFFFSFCIAFSLLSFSPSFVNLFLLVMSLPFFHIIAVLINFDCENQPNHRRI